MRRFMTLTVMLMSACASGPTADQIAIAQQNGRAPGTIQTGDSAWYVQSQWGAPDQSSASVYADGERHEWWDYCWRGYYYELICDQSVHFVDGKVYAIHQ